MWVQWACILLLLLLLLRLSDEDNDNERISNMHSIDNNVKVEAT